VDGKNVNEVVEKLWRKDPGHVRSLFHSISSNRICDGWRLNGYHRKIEERAKRKLLIRRTIGLTINEVVNRSGIARPTLVSLMELHGLLELVPYGLEQKRRLVTEQAFEAGLGHNVSPANRIGHLEGYGKAALFPVFEVDRIEDILWMLDYSGIKKTVSEQPNKKARLSYLLDQHAYFPDAEIGHLAGYSMKSVSRSRPRATEAAFQPNLMGHSMATIVHH
jgi:hypothetical protein